jgi:hypothetical protein
MRFLLLWAACLLPLGLAPAGRPAAALTIGQVDTFDQDVSGWFVPGPSPTPPQWVASGGPGGAGDGWLQLAATGGTGSGSRLAVLNASQWAGDYASAGIGAIAMDVSNFGPDDLALRLLFENPASAGGAPSDAAFSTNAVLVPAGSGWTRVVFPIAASDLTAAFGNSANALATATVLRLFHNTAAAWPGPGSGPEPVTATLGVDGIQALPEPAAAALVAAGGAVLGAVARRRTRR